LSLRSQPVQLRLNYKKKVIANFEEKKLHEYGGIALINSWTKLNSLMKVGKRQEAKIKSNK
jgi:hypothetical protein